MPDDLLKLVGRRVLIQISDPWEFGTDVGTHPIPGVVERVTASEAAQRDGVTRTEEIVIRVERPFAYKKHKCEFFRATPRHEGATFGNLRTGRDGLGQLQQDSEYRRLWRREHRPHRIDLRGSPGRRLTRRRY